jgi:hypothetical protein
VSDPARIARRPLEPAVPTTLPAPIGAYDEGDGGIG